MTQTQKKGIVYLVGAGPGDPGLITVRGLEVLQQAEIVIYDYLANPLLLKNIPQDCETIYVGKKVGQHTLKQEEINALLVEKCSQGKNIVRLKGGDPFVFGRGGEEALALVEAGLSYEIIPGITSGIAAPAYAGIPVTQRGSACTLGIVTGHENPEKDKSDLNWQALANAFGTLVFYMGVGNLPMISEQLIKHGRSPQTPVALVRWGTRPDQQTLVGTLENIAQKVADANFKPPSIIVVGDVVNLRQQLSWIESRPLFGKRILVTRSRAQAGDLSLRLQKLGAEALEFPVIKTTPPEYPEPLGNSVNKIEQYDWIIFTSVNAVDYFFAEMHQQNKDSRDLSGIQICAIGPATEKQLVKQGLLSDLVPKKYIADSIIEDLSQTGDIVNLKILLPQSEIAFSLLKDELVKMGVQVDSVVAYRTLHEQPENLAAIQEDLACGKIDAVTFTSSSTVRNFTEIVGPQCLEKMNSQICLASIGPQTSKTVSKLLGDKFIQAEQHTIDGLIEILLQQFNERTNN